MKKKIVVTLISLLLLSILAGCVSEKETEPDDEAPENNPPIAVISASGIINSPPDYINLSLMDAVVYAGDTVTFDASESYDPDGDDISYRWIWEDNTDTVGIKVTRQFEVDNIFDLQGLPLIFSVVLLVEDEIYASHLEYMIGVIPKEYVFYLDSNELQLEKPANGKDLIKVTPDRLKSAQELNYKLEESIHIQKCVWNATIHLEKPLFLLVNKLSITFYDDEGNEITREDENLGFILWRKKKIQITGSFNEGEEFKSLKLVIYGFSLREKTGVLYGDDVASRICFDFTSQQ